MRFTTLFLLSLIAIASSYESPLRGSRREDEDVAAVEQLKELSAPAEADDLPAAADSYASRFLTSFQQFVSGAQTRGIGFDNGGGGKNDKAKGANHCFGCMATLLFCT